jgi:GNAT superfamily N-acetyltransferase
MSLHLRLATEADREAWAPLWDDYLNFYQHTLVPEVTEMTFRRLIDPKEPMFLWLAVEGDQVVGFATVIFHRSTWARESYAYLEDLFVTEASRGSGVARQLIETVAHMSRHTGAERLYWMTQSTNKTAQALYDKLAEKSGFIQYQKNL